MLTPDCDSYDGVTIHSTATARGTATMQPQSLVMRHFGFSFAVAFAFIACCYAQEIASLDLTKVSAHVELRRPPATSAIKTGYHGIESTTRCSHSTLKQTRLEASLVSLDRLDYQLGDEPTFEVRVQNVGFTSITIPFSPHLADLQPEDPEKQFSYLELNITLWIASGERWSSSSGGQVSLYGASNHAHTTVTLYPGEWVRVVGRGHLTLSEGGSITFHEYEVRRDYPPDHMYAEASLCRKETLITPTGSATAGREVCLWKEHGQSIPIRLITRSW